MAIASGLLLLAVPSIPAETGGAPTVDPEYPVTAANMLAMPANNSPQLVEDPRDPRFVALANRLDGPDFSCALQVSGDGGRRWVPANPVPRLPTGADKCYAPQAAFGADGRLYYLFVGLHGRGNSPMGAFLTESTDHARTFSPPHQVLGGERYMVRMAIDRTMGRLGRIHLVWLQASAAPGLGGFPPTPNPIMSAFSDDGGRHLSTPVQVSDPGRARVVAPALALAPHHGVDVLYYDLGRDARDYEGLEGPRWSESWSLVLSSSSDGGAHFGSGTVVDSHLVPPERVMLIFTMPAASLVADRSGRLVAAWDDARNGDWDVFLRRSLDGGRTWSGPLRLNDDRLHDGRNQYLPRLSVAPDGRVDAIFYDRRNDPANRRNDVYYTYSIDGGATFAPNVRVTSWPSDTAIGPRYSVTSALGLVEFGSRLGLLSATDHVLAAWTDTHDEGRAPRAQDIYATDVRFHGGGARAWIHPLGVALLAIGVAALAVTGGWVVLQRRGRGGHPRRPRAARARL